jgi:hypothetical protein
MAPELFAFTKNNRGLTTCNAMPINSLRMHRQEADMLRRMMQSVSNLYEYTANSNPDDATYQDVVREDFGKILGCTTSGLNLARDLRYDQDQTKNGELEKTIEEQVRDIEDLRASLALASNKG